MTVSPQHPYLTPEQYLEAEKHSPIKHEYIDGEVYAMAGASDAHVTIAINLTTLLRSCLRGSNCRLYASDMKLRIESRNRFYYPDLLVTCDDRDRSTNYYKRFPTIVIEILSTSTESFDRGDKFADYCELDSLQDYLLISQNRQRVDRFSRDSQNRWIFTRHEVGDVLTIDRINFSCAVADIYEDVEIDRIG